MSLGWRFALATAILVGLGMTSAMVSTRAVEESHGYTVLVNLGGRQRMLSQRVMLYTRASSDAASPKEAHELRQKALAACDESEASAKIFDSLRIGHVPGPYAAITLSPAARQLYDGPDRVQGLLAEYLRRMRAILDESAAATPEEITTVRVMLQEKLIPALDPFVYQLQEDSRYGLKRLQNMNMVLFGALVATLLLQVFWVFMPLAYSLRRALRGAKKALDENNETQRSLQAAERLARTIADCTTEGIVVLADGKIIDCNSTFKNMYGFTTESFENLDPVDLIAPERRAASRKRLADGVATPLDTLGLRQNGQIFPLRVSVRVYVADGTGVRVVSMQDLTEQRESEAVLQRARYTAESAARFRSEFLANMSHEIRTPLNAIMGMTDLLLESTMDGEQRRYGEIIRTSGDHLLMLINDILDLAKIEAGNMQLESAPLDVRFLVETQTDVFLGRARQKGLELQSYIDPAMATTLLGDAGRIKQIILNFLNNAMKFTETGRIVVSAEVDHEDESGCLVAFKVQDTGIGIAADVVERLFTPFTQADGSTARRFGGTGLGLSICKQLATLMGGQVGVTTEPGKGSTFWFTVRLRKAPQGAVRASPLDRSIIGIRALVVDDDPISREILERYLHAWHVEVLTAADHQSACDTHQNEIDNHRSIDLVIIDLRMPGLDGFHTSSALHALPGQEGTPHILITAYDQPRMLQSATAHGFAGYITKPVRQSVLLDTIVNTRLCRLPIDTPEAPSDMPQKSGRKRILVAEDNSVNQLLVLTHLKNLGYEAQAVGNGRDVLTSLETDHWDLILLDCQMPVMDGYEAAQAIRVLEASLNRRTPVVALTANAMREDQERCLRAGMDDYISKPIKRDVLARTLERWLNKPPA